MSAEISKAAMRWSADRRFTTRFLTGDGIDISGVDESFLDIVPFFPTIRSVRVWRRGEGNAALVTNVADGSFDFVHSSHLLEHLPDPYTALRSWIRICRPGGHLILLVPDEDLYEQGQFPSSFNAEHRWTFTLRKPTSWSARSINVLDMLLAQQDVVEIVRAEVIDTWFDRTLPRVDQTQGPRAESAIEIVLRRRPVALPVARGVWGERLEAGRPPASVLVNRRGALGDVIMATPVVAQLRRDLGPSARLDVCTLSAGVFAGNPHVNHAGPELRPSDYEFVIDLDGVYETAPFRHPVDAYLRHVFGDATALDRTMTLRRDPALPELSLDWWRVVAIHPAQAGWATRTMPRAFWQELVDALRAAGTLPLLVGGGHDRRLGASEGVIDQVGAASLHQTAYLISRAACFVGCDTGLLHVAGTTDVPIVALFTVVRPELRLPYRNGRLGYRATALTPALDCIGCGYESPGQCHRGLACVGSGAVSVTATVEAVLRMLDPRAVLPTVMAA